MTQPKKRVYELARELNMTNKSLLEKISSLDLGLNSHMSTLDEDTEARIRHFIQGGTEPTLVEKRVKPTVIRRRRKAVEAPPAPEATSVEAAAAEAQKDQEAAEDKVAETAAGEEVETPADAAPDEAVEPAEESAAGATADAGEASVDAAPEILERSAEPDSKASEANGAIADTDTTGREAESAAAAASEKETQGAVAQVDEPGPAAAAEEGPEQQQTLKAKKRSEAAAKIIKLPEKPVTPVSRKAASPDTRPAPISPRGLNQPVAVVPVEPPQPDDRGKKKAKKKGFRQEDPQAEKRFPKKRSSFRKKSVVEGADLYSKRQRGRKGRKGVKGRGAAVGQKTQITTAKAIKRRIKIDETIILAELAKRMGIKAAEMIARLMGMGVMATVKPDHRF
jgi:translation initiation factor IF-2